MGYLVDVHAGCEILSRAGFIRSRRIAAITRQWEAFRIHDVEVTVDYGRISVSH